MAAVLGGLIGLERERAGKPAGLRTHLLVAASAALLMLLGDESAGPDESAWENRPGRRRLPPGCF